MKTKMPFDTEMERKPLKVWEFAFSWRQCAYLAVSLVVFIQYLQYVVIMPGFSFVISLVLFFLGLLLFSPAFIFGFIRNGSTGLYIDKYLLYYLRHKKNETGIWRNK